MCRDSFIRDVTHAYMTWLIHTWRDSCICDMTHPCATPLRFRQRQCHRHLNHINFLFHTRSLPALPHESIRSQISRHHTSLTKIRGSKTNSWRQWPPWPPTLPQKKSHQIKKLKEAFATTPIHPDGLESVSFTSHTKTGGKQGQFSNAPPYTKKSGARFLGTRRLLIIIRGVARSHWMPVPPSPHKKNRANKKTALQKHKIISPDLQVAQKGWALFLLSR